MALQPIIAAGDGPRVTVAELVKSPTAIPRRILNLMDQQFIVDALLRQGGSSDSGVWTYHESSPLFLDQNTGIREEFGEYPILTSSEGALKVVISSDRGFSLIISKEMRRKNQMDRVNQMMTQGRNTMTRDWETAFRLALLASAVPTQAASASWGTTTTKIRYDIYDAQQAVGEAINGAQTNDFLGFTADTMVMSVATKTKIFKNDDFVKVYEGNTSDQSIRFTGKLPQTILGLTPLVSRTWPDTEVLICERNTLGFIGDEEPLQATPLYYREENKYWRTDTNRSAAIGIDQPKAAIRITGI